ncbi:MAG: glutathione S-transferase family protein [Proteobacteria bacterium]|nr:glutathione S-transferase family protein [Pseudomonadota bacterium]
MTIKLYDNPVSGHAHRVRLFLSLLGIEFESENVNMREGEHKTRDYLKLSPLGQVPTLVDGDVVITDSCAALVYLAKRYGDERWLPEDPEGAAKVQRWLSSASGELYRGPVIARAIELFGRDHDYDAAVQWSDRLFPWMQQELADRTWLAADHATIADVAMYSYMRVADEGGLDISDYPAILRWLSDVESLDGFISMTRAN